MQATKDGEEALVSQVLQTTRDAGRVADLFAGSGTFSLPLAARAEVRAVFDWITERGAQEAVT